MVRKKVGTITLALGLIGVGVLLFAQNFIQLPVADLYKYWPVLLIGLGIEMIAYMIIYGHEGSNVKLGIDGLCIFFIIVLGLYASGAGFMRWSTPDHMFQGVHINGFNLDGIRYRSELDEAYTKENISSSYNIKEVKISNDYGDIKVLPSNAKAIKIEAHVWVKYNDEQKARQYAQNAIEIKEGETTEIRPKAVSEAEKKDFSRAQIDLTVYVPDNVTVSIDEKFGDVDVANVKANVNIDSKNGEVNTENIEGNATVASAFGNVNAKNIKGDVNLSNRNGNIEADGITGLAAIDSSYGNINAENIGKDLKVNGRNGEIQLSNISGKAEVENSYGNIQLESIKGDLTVSGRNGNIQISNAAANVKADNAYGDINYSSGNINDAKINAHTSYGEISSGKNLSISKTATEADLKGTLGSGKWSIDLTTRNGNVHIE